MERRLSEQERRILRLHGSGLSSSEIARRLGISETTVAFIVGNLVGEWGAARTEDLARALSISRREQLVAQLALPLAVMLVLALATVAVLGVTGTLHGPLFAPDQSHSASPTSSASPGPATGVGSSATPGVTETPPAADGNTPPGATPAPVAPTLRLVTLPPVIPTIVPLPTAVPSAPLPLPPLPTVPPLPTPTLPPLQVPRL